MIDVCLLLEGTYPYVAGGVSSWVYQLIQEFHDLSFAIVYLGSHRSTPRRLHYEIPNNVVDIREFYLFDYRVEREKNFPIAKENLQKMEEFFLQVKNNDTASFNDIYYLVGHPQTRRLSLFDLVYSREAWEMVKRLYAREETTTSFIDYFWTWRFIYLPFFSLLKVDLPRAKVYHAASTGYAGVLGALCKLRYDRPFLLTEHGIYTRERKIEISRADWIYSASANEIKVVERKDIFREWWITLFSYFSRLTYERADEIITLYEGNRKIQVEEGADPTKIKIIPNGVDFKRYDALKKQEHSGPLRIGFVGRVVPIKDVKTFIMACRRICDEIKNIEVYILGPVDEDEEYYRECVLLTKMETMEDVIQFKGKVDTWEYYSLLDVIVLTSLSEAQPLVILEAMACGVAVVATDVGACRELLYGSSADDQLLGQSGLITPICDAESTAEAVLRILRNAHLRKNMGEVGKARVQTYYQLNDFIANYQMLYSRYMQEIRWPELSLKQLEKESLNTTV